ncbi:hypothetical protein PTTG_09996 [Puccinia triticina 1-1 BBBD Race 1]|uniref:Uncharacterized protein n=1 Tax=Puccinia triticina (isolate 1-1 / race 1 (BBBD)) TaxID=630390 RepID=A0A180G874_PUCT1|nr:hypothetical protein PTTG_09996 [Puccinia triticina 1-1 BBBD Race 1]
MSTQQTVSSDQLLPPIDTEAGLRTANKAKRIAKQVAKDQALIAAAPTGPPIPGSSYKGPSIPTGAPGINIEPPTNISCPASLSSLLTLPPAVEFKTATSTSLFSNDAPDPSSLRAWPVIPPTSIRPPPPPLGPFNPAASAPPVLPPTDKQGIVTPTMSTQQPSPTPASSAAPATTQGTADLAAEAPKPALTLDGPSMLSEMHQMTLQIQQASLDAQLAADAVELLTVGGERAWRG